MAGLLNVADVSIHYRQRTCHNIGPARERAFISVCENKGIKNNIYTIAVSKSTLVIGLMLINNGFREHNMAARYRRGECLFARQKVYTHSVIAFLSNVHEAALYELFDVSDDSNDRHPPDVKKCRMVTT